MSNVDSAVSLEERKRVLRRRMRSQAPPSALAALRAGERVAALLAESPFFAAARSILLFAALPDEIPTRPCFDLSLAAGKQVLFGRCEGQSLVFAPVERWEELRSGRYGLLEPTAAAVRGRVDAPAPWLWLVPGLAFDRQGGRLGRGGGYYDRALAARVEAGVVVGLGYAKQWIEAVPMGSLDVRMDALLSEDGWAGCGAGRTAGRGR